jgi:hypothetical protein
MPLSFGPYMSPRMAETFEIGADAKTPPKNLVIKTLAAFLLVAVPMLKIARIKCAGSIDHLRP